METIGITAFRRSLKHYLEEASASGNTIYQVGAGTDVLLLSPAALEHLQQRHFVNRWVRGRLSALKLDQYPTLSGGKDTKALSLEHLLALNALFQLATEVLDVLSHTGAKQNAMRWDISEYTKPKAVPKHGRFDTVHTVIRTCFEPWTMDQFRERKTLYEFFDFLRTVTELDRACRRREEGDEDYEPRYTLWEGESSPVTFLRSYGASAEQMDFLADGVLALCTLMMELLSFQVETGDSPDYPLLLCNDLFTWYEEHIAPLPKSFAYKPVCGI